MADLVSYVPKLVFDDCFKLQEEVEGGELPGWKPRFHEFWGAVVFADVSGFTKLSERLAAAAEREGGGSESLVAYLNEYFGELIDVVTAHGGDVVKFAGDALLACWPQREGETKGETLLRAVQASAAIEHTLNVDDEDTPYLHMGISAGDLYLLQVGGTFNRSECVLTGAPLLQLSDAVPAASPKYSVLSPEAWALLPQGAVLGSPVNVDGEETGPETVSGGDNGELVKLLEIVNPIPPLPLGSNNVDDLDKNGMSLLMRFVPGSIKSAVSEGQQSWLSGSRKATVMFIHIRGIDMSVGDCLPSVHSAVLAVQEAVYKYEGSINKILLDDKGFLILAGFGLPPLSHEDDELRGVLSALRVQAKLKGLGMKCDVGVTTGTVFCGIVGNETRREYTMMGDVVNTAARYMASAKGSVYVDEATVSDCPPDSMQFDELAPRSFKGKKGLLRVFQPSRKRLRLMKSRRPNKLVRSLETMKRSKACPLIGRQKESSLISSILSSLKRNDYANIPGPVLVFSGERGIGKGRVLEEANRLASKSRFLVFPGRGDAMAANSFLHPWAPVFRKLLRLPRERESDPDTIALLHDTAREMVVRVFSDEQASFAAVLNPLLEPVTFEECQELAGMSDKERIGKSLELLPGMFEALFLDSGKAGVLVLQDYQHFDPSSRALLVSIMSLTSLKLGAFVSTTPPGDSVSAEYADLTALESVQVVELQALSQNAISKLVASRLGVKTLPPAVSELVVDKCGGNPFFAQELGTALLESGVLARSEDGSEIVVVDSESLSLDMDGVSLPTALRGVITSRIDKLQPSHLRLLKVAAAMGSNIAVSVLADVFAILDAEDPAARVLSENELEEGLDRLVVLSFLTRVEATGGYQFKTALTQDVVYSLMLSSQQHAVHAAIAQYYERVAEADSIAVEALAYHWRHADTSDLVVANKAIRYLEQAAMSSLDQGNPRRALAHLQEALSLYSHLTGSDTKSRLSESGPSSSQAGDDDAALMGTVKVLLLRVAAMASLQIGHLTRARRYAVQALTILSEPVEDGESLDSLMARVDASIESIKSHALPDSTPDQHTTIDELRFRDELDEELITSGTLKKREKYGTLKRSFSEFLQDKERLHSSMTGSAHSTLEWHSTDEFASFSTLDEFRFSALDDAAGLATDGLDSGDDAYFSAADEPVSKPVLEASAATIPSPLRHQSTPVLDDSDSDSDSDSGTADSDDEKSGEDEVKVGSGKDNNDNTSSTAVTAKDGAVEDGGKKDGVEVDGSSSDDDDDDDGSSSSSTSSSSGEEEGVQLEAIKPEGVEEQGGGGDQAHADPNAQPTGEGEGKGKEEEEGGGGGGCCTIS